MRRWEYITLQVVASGFEDEDENANYHLILNEYGGEGWELVSTASYPGQVIAGTIIVMFFKREIGES